MNPIASRRRTYVPFGHTLATALWLALCGAVLLATHPALGQDEKLPKGEVILDKYVEATGGKAAHSKIKNRVARGTFEIPGQQQSMTGSLLGYSARPYYVHSIVEIPGVMKQERGTDGKIAWKRRSMAGAVLIEGDEREQFLREAFFDKDVEWRKLYKKAKTVGIEDVNGKPAYKVELTIDDSNKMTAFYDKESHLLVKTTTIAKTPRGETPIETYFSDYKDVGGVLTSHAQRQRVLGPIPIEQTFTFQSIKANVELPEDCFELPDEVKELVKQKKQTTTPKKKEPTP
jgi:hypothetical protein